MSVQRKIAVVVSEDEVKLYKRRKYLLEIAYQIVVLWIGKYELFRSK